MTTSQRDQAQLAQGWMADFNWADTDWNGIDLTVPSPTCDGETLGESIRRTANDFYVEVQEVDKLGPNKATSAEAQDILVLFPGSGELFNTAVSAGFDIRASHENPIQMMLEAIKSQAGRTDIGDDAAHHPVGDINPRYASLVVGDSGGSVGGPTLGRLTTKTYDGDPDQF